MDAKIIVNRTTDWGNLDIQTFVRELTASDGMFYSPSLDNANRQMLIDNLARWAKFKISYPVYRRKLEELAIDSWRKLGIPWRELWHRHWPANPNRVYLITDDDDWYHPGLLDEVMPLFADPEIDIVTWDCWKYILVWDREEFKIHDTIGSNGYAQRGGTIGSRGHLDVEEYTKKHPDRCVHIAKPLSIWTRHPGTFSQLTLYPLTESYHWLRKSPRPECLAWATNYMDSLHELITTEMIPKTEG